MKEIKEMSINEISSECDNLWVLLSITDDTGTYDLFTWNGLDYWDTCRRRHKLSRELILRS